MGTSFPRMICACSVEEGFTWLGNKAFDAKENLLREQT